MSEAWGSPEVVEMWQRHAEARNRMLASATDAMFDLAGVVVGARVLDLGTGTGDTALAAAARVGVGGSVLATDAAENMVEAATRAVRDAGATNVELRVMPIEAIDVDASSFDAAIARLVLMFTPDRRRALVGAREALREGGRFAAMVWGSPADNPFHCAVLDAARANGGMPSSEPELSRAFSMSDVASLGRALREVGFRDVVVRVVPSTRAFASADAALTNAKDSPIFAEVLAALDDAARDRAWRSIEAVYRTFERDERCDFPMANLVVGGTR